MRLSYVIYNRDHCDALLNTLARLPAITPLPAQQWEAIVADDASRDETVTRVGARFGNVQVVQSRRQRDRAAMNAAFNKCKGEYVIWLDAGTQPADGRAVRLALDHLRHRPAVAAVSGQLLRAEGAALAPDFPTVIMPGATCFRRAALHRLGGFDPGIQGHCADYDLSFRLWQNGLHVERREDVQFEQIDVAAPDPVADVSDLRNHLVLARRFLPMEIREVYEQDWLKRCKALARAEGGFMKIRRQIMSTIGWTMRQSLRTVPDLGESATEQIFGIRRQAQWIGQWARQYSVWRVVLVDFSKNIWSAYNACRCTGLQMRCVADNNHAFNKMEYRGLPIVPINRAFEGGGIDGVVLCNLNPVQIERRIRSIRHHFKGPLLRLWQPPREAQQVEAAAA